MKIKRLDHVGINVEDLAAAKAFFLDLGLKVMGNAELKGKWLDKIVDLKGVHTEFMMLSSSDGEANVELIKYHSPPDKKGIQKSAANTLGIRHICFNVEDIEGILKKLKKKGFNAFSEIYNYENTFKLCYVHGPEGIIVELAENVK